MSKHIIRTSDRAMFKQCRQLWDWASLTRDALEPDASYRPFEFGTAWHSAMETFYEPELWDKPRETVQSLSVQSFVDVTIKQRSKYVDENGYLDDELKEDFLERLSLGRGMLENYFSWSKLHDNFKPAKVEAEFEVPVLVPIHLGEIKPVGRVPMICECHGWPVVYQGRLDGIVEDPQGRYWIKEHKTTGQMGRTDHLELDPQCGSYLWAMKQLGVACAGVIYTQALKDFPSPPLRLVTQRKGRWFSVNQQARTTYELYLKTITEANEPIHLYAEHLDFLKAKDDPFIRRIQVERPAHAIDYMGDLIYHEALDMINADIPIYPNPSYFNCNGCRFREPCIAKQNGYDYQFVLDELYKPRTTV